MQDFLDRERRPSTRRFHDGHPVLPGFILSDKPVAEGTWFVLLCQQRLTRLNVSSCPGSKFLICKVGRVLSIITRHSRAANFFTRSWPPGSHAV